MKVVLTAEQIQKRVREMARQLSDDYRGRTIHAVCVLENAFIFMADLVRALDAGVVCHFVRSDISERQLGDGTSVEIFFGPEPKVKGEHVLLVEGLIDTGVTTDFLVRNIVGRGAASVRTVALLDRHVARRVPLQPDYFGFVVDEDFLFGYGLGATMLDRNLPCVAKLEQVNAAG